jgi:hypothetical protein
MVKVKRTKGQTTIYKTLNNTNQHTRPGWIQVLAVPTPFVGPIVLVGEFSKDGIGPYLWSCAIHILGSSLHVSASSLFPVKEVWKIYLIKSINDAKWNIGHTLYLKFYIINCQQITNSTTASDNKNSDQSRLSWTLTKLNELLLLSKKWN